MIHLNGVDKGMDRAKGRFDLWNGIGRKPRNLSVGLTIDWSDAVAGAVRALVRAALARRDRQVPLPQRAHQTRLAALPGNRRSDL